MRTLYPDLLSLHTEQILRSIENTPGIAAGEHTAPYYVRIIMTNARLATLC